MKSTNCQKTVKVAVSYKNVWTKSDRLNHQRSPTKAQAQEPIKELVQELTKVLAQALTKELVQEPTKELA